MQKGGKIAGQKEARLEEAGYMMIILTGLRILFTDS